MEEITPEELDAIEARCASASPGPWRSLIEGRDHWSGSDFIMTGPGDARGEDIEMSGATHADRDFIAAARQDVPRLVAEVRRLRALLPPPVDVSDADETGWYSAKVRLAAVVESVGVLMHMDRIHLFRAAGWEQARERALEVWRRHEQRYVNGDGRTVEWKLKELLTLDIIAAPSLDGAEVYSDLIEVAPDDVDARPDQPFAPEASRPFQAI